MKIPQNITDEYEAILAIARDVRDYDKTDKGEIFENIGLRLGALISLTRSMLRGKELKLFDKFFVADIVSAKRHACESMEANSIDPTVWFEVVTMRYRAIGIIHWLIKQPHRVSSKS
jgi:hypothetical protein